MSNSQEHYLSGGADRSITIRLPGALHDALATHASAMGFSSLSKAIRSLLAASLRRSSEGERTANDGSLKGGDQ